MNDSEITLAIDAMGGAHAPPVAVRGASLALRSHPRLRFLLFGDEPALAQELKRKGNSALKSVAEICHAPDTIADDDKPSAAVRRGRESSMWLALQAVGEKRAIAAVSGGNTGAFMAMARLNLKPMAGVHRPAIASFLPSAKGPIVLLDLGATVQCSARNLVEFAIMGTAFAHSVLDKENPTCALLNVGEEDVKGHEELREAARLMQDVALPGKFIGFVEGHDIAQGSADVIVTDGFTGNIALKTAEGAVNLLNDTLRQRLKASFASRLGALLVGPSLKRGLSRYDPRHHNGAVFLGLDGLAIKSHGRMDEIGFARALEVAAALSEHHFLHQVQGAIAHEQSRTLNSAPNGDGASPSTSPAGESSADRPSDPSSGSAPTGTSTIG